METNKLPLSSMPDVCFSGWFRVIDFMIRHKPVLLILFPFSFVFIRKITRLFFVILDTLISQFVWLLLWIYAYCNFVNLSTLNK